MFSIGNSASSNGVDETGIDSGGTTTSNGSSSTGAIGATGSDTGRGVAMMDSSSTTFSVRFSSLKSNSGLVSSPTSASWLSVFLSIKTSVLGNRFSKEILKLIRMKAAKTNSRISNEPIEPNAKFKVLIMAQPIPPLNIKVSDEVKKNAINAGNHSRINMLYLNTTLVGTNVNLNSDLIPNLNSIGTKIKAEIPNQSPINF